MNNNTNANGATFDPYLTWLGIRDPQRPPNHYRLLGLELFENDPEVIAASADRQMTYVRTYQAGQQAEHSQRILNELTTAKLCLLKPERKRDYDQRLQAAQRPIPQPPTQPPQVRPAAAATPPMYSAGQPAMQPRPLQAGYASHVPHPAQQAAYQDEQPPFGSSPVSVHSNAARGAKKSSIMQWSIVGGLVLATVILAVVLANKFSSPETPPVATNTNPPKVTPTTAKNPATTPSAVTTPEANGQTQPVTEVTEPKNTEPVNSEKSPATASTKQGPGPVKAPLPNTALPGTEEPIPAQPSPMNPAPVNPAPMNPAPAVTPSNPAVPATIVPVQPTVTTPPVTTPAPPAVVAKTNDDPLNSLPTTNSNTPTQPQPVGNPLNPLAEPTNPLAMPIPLGVNPPTGEMPKPAAPRRPLPSEKEIADSRAKVRESFKSQYTTKAPSLGKDLLKSARESAGEPAIMYTTYDEARLVGAILNDLETVFTVHTEITREFAVEPDKDLLESVKALTKGAPSMSPDQAGSVLDIIGEQVSNAILDQHLETADQLLRNAASFISRVADKPSRETNFRDLQRRLVEHKAFAAKATQYKETLAKNPEDGEANLELGRFWAFYQGNFEKGLSYLAKGSDSEIREAAKQELALTPDSTDLAKVGAAWWEVSNKLPPEPKATVKVHAAFAYARALPKLKALDRVTAESRINEAFKLFKPTNREVKEIIKLLITRANWKMQWKGKSQDDTLGFNATGTCSSEEYPSWKLLDNLGVGYVVCIRDPNFQGDRGGGGGNRFNKRGPGNGNDNISKSGELMKNVMQIRVLATNRINVVVLGDDGKPRSEGAGTPE